MNKDDTLILDFCSVLAAIRSLCRDTHIYLERLECFKQVQTIVSPFRQAEDRDDFQEYARRGVSLSFFIDADLAKIIDVNKCSLGFSLVIRYSGDHWVAEGEIGWSGRDVGGDTIASHDLSAKSINEFIKGLPTFTEQVLKEYRLIVQEHVSRETGHSPEVPRTRD